MAQKALRSFHGLQTPTEKHEAVCLESAKTAKDGACAPALVFQEGNQSLQRGSLSNRLGSGTAKRSGLSAVLRFKHDRAGKRTRMSHYVTNQIIRTCSDGHQTNSRFFPWLWDDMSCDTITAVDRPAPSESRNQSPPAQAQVQQTERTPRCCLRHCSCNDTSWIQLGLNANGPL